MLTLFYTKSHQSPGHPVALIFKFPVSKARTGFHMHQSITLRKQFRLGIKQIANGYSKLEVISHGFTSSRILRPCYNNRDIPTMPLGAVELAFDAYSTEKAMAEEKILSLDDTSTERLTSSPVFTGINNSMRPE